MLPTRPTPPKASPAADGPAQPPLIPLSDSELKGAAKKLAQKIRDLADRETADQKDRKAARAGREKLRNEIAAIASTIRTQGR